MKSALSHLAPLVLAGVLATPAGVNAAEPAVTQIKGPMRPVTQRWLGLTTGLVSAGVDIPCKQGDPGDCDEGGMFQTFGLNLTVAGRSAVRFRYMQAQEDTEDKPYETAALVGPRLGRSHWYGLVGYGHIGNPDNDYPGSVSGLAWEFIRVRPSSKGAGFELSIHGNSFGDASFAGIGIGLRLGKLR